MRHLAELKTGYLVGATPARQQLGQLIGAAFACWAVAGTVLLLGNTYELGGKEIAAPQATLMKTIIEGVLSGDLPKDLVLCGVSALAFAIGVYLPLATMSAIYLGGCARALRERLRKRAPDASKGEERGDPRILAASGVVAGEGLAGVFVAGSVALGWLPKSAERTLAAGIGGELLTALMLVLVGAFCLRAARSRER